MRALIPTGRPGDLVEIADIDRPVPADDQALVRVTEFSLNRTDFLHLSSPDTAYRPGVDAVGLVERAAADGSGPSAGQRVVIHLPGGGAAAQYVAVAADRVVPVPDGVPSDVAAALPLAGLVARRMLAKAGPLSGRRILATGVTGGVGQFVVQLAVAEGAQVTAVAAESDTLAAPPRPRGPRHPRRHRPGQRFFRHCPGVRRRSSRQHSREETRS